MIRLKAGIFVSFLLLSICVKAQQLTWAKEGNAYYKIEGSEIVKYTLPALTKEVVVGRNKLLPKAGAAPINKLLLPGQYGRGWLHLYCGR